MFNKTYEFQKIKKELEAINALDEYALFECYGDSIATFGFRKYSAYHQFCVICHDSFSREIQLADLLELKRITFFSHAVFLEKLGTADERLDSVSWSMYESSGLN
jgi:hypothetical protein